MAASHAGHVQADGSHASQIAAAVCSATPIAADVARLIAGFAVSTTQYWDRATSAWVSDDHATAACASQSVTTPVLGKFPLRASPRFALALDVCASALTAVANPVWAIGVARESVRMDPTNGTFAFNTGSARVLIVTGAYAPPSASAASAAASRRPQWSSAAAAATKTTATPAATSLVFNAAANVPYSGDDPPPDLGFAKVVPRQFPTGPRVTALPGGRTIAAPLRTVCVDCDVAAGVVRFEVECSDGTRQWLPHTFTGLHDLGDYYPYACLTAAAATFLSDEQYAALHPHTRSAAAAAPAAEASSSSSPAAAAAAARVVVPPSFVTPDVRAAVCAATDGERLTSDGQWLVFDAGAVTMKGGFAGDDAPRAVYPTRIGFVRVLIPAMTQYGLRSQYVGDEALTRRCLCVAPLAAPFRGGGGGHTHPNACAHHYSYNAASASGSGSGSGSGAVVTVGPVAPTTAVPAGVRQILAHERGPQPPAGPYVPPGAVSAEEQHNACAVLHHTFYNELSVAPEEHPLLIAEPLFHPAAMRAALLHMLFGVFDVPALCVVPRPTLALLSTGRVTGLSVELGGGAVTVVPVYQGFCVRHCARVSTHLSGMALADHALACLRAQTTSAEQQPQQSDGQQQQQQQQPQHADAKHAPPSSSSSPSSPSSGPRHSLPSGDGRAVAHDTADTIIGHELMKAALVSATQPPLRDPRAPVTAAEATAPGARDCEFRDHADRTVTVRLLAHTRHALAEPLFSPDRLQQSAAHPHRPPAPALQPTDWWARVCTDTALWHGITASGHATDALAAEALASATAATAATAAATATASDTKTPAASAAAAVDDEKARLPKTPPPLPPVPGSAQALGAAHDRDARLASHALPRLIVDAIAAADPALQPELWRNIVVTGGYAGLDGLKARLERELTALAPASARAALASSGAGSGGGGGVTVQIPSDHRFGVWIGGSILGSVPYGKTLLCLRSDWAPERTLAFAQRFLY